MSASQYETGNTAVLAIFCRPGHLKVEAARGRLNQSQARLCCESCSGSDRDRHGILPRKAAGMRTQSAVRVPAAAAQVGLHNGVRGQ